MALAHFGDFGRAGVEAELRTYEAHQAGVLRGQGFVRHLDRTATQLRVADQVLAVFFLQQQAGALALQQQNGGQEVLGNAVQRALDDARGKLGARRGARKQGRGQAVLFQRQAGRQGLGCGCHAMQARDFNQAVQQRVIVRRASVGAPFPSRRFR
ncbi:hypothetical protein D3C85_540090 [compost metagenome]